MLEGIFEMLFALLKETLKSHLQLAFLLMFVSFLSFHFLLASLVAMFNFGLSLVAMLKLQTVDALLIFGGEVFLAKD